MVASPKVNNSKFSPVITIGRSPQMTKKTAPKLSGFGKLDDEKNNKQSLLSKFGGSSGGQSKIDTKIVDHDFEHELEPLSDLDLNSGSSNSKYINVNRKQRNIFKNIDSLESSHNQVKNQDEDLPITEGIKASSKKKDDDKEYYKL
jgi:hypothetical protein